MSDNVIDFIEHSLKDKKNKANHKILNDLLVMDGKITEIVNDFIADHKNSTQARCLLFMALTLTSEAVSAGLTFEQEMACLKVLADHENK